MKRGALISPDMFVLHPALSNFGLPFYPVFAAFFPSVLFWQVFGKNCLSSPNYARLVFFSPPSSSFIFITTEVSTSVHRRFGDERDGIIPIPALLLSRSNSLTKLSDSILAPTARVNLLCHLQSTRGGTQSRSSLCQNPPIAPLLRSIQVYFFSSSLSLYAVRLSAYISCSVLLLSFRLCCVSCCIYSGGNTAECS